MRKFFYLLILLTITAIQVKSQAHNIRFPESEIHGAGIPLPHEIGYIEGTRYLDDDFKSGTVHFDNSKILQASLRLNLYHDEFEYIKNDIVYALSNLDRTRINKVVMDNQVFIYLEPISETHVSGFVISWNTELPTIITKMRTDFYGKENNLFGYKPERFERDEDRHYIMNADGKIERIKSVKKLIKYLGTHQEELSRFAKEEKISANDPKELAKLLDYFQDLEHQSPV